MPNVAMYARAAHPNGWHAVTAPGGYEGWIFEAEDATGTLHLSIKLLAGAWFDPGYLRWYRRYVKRPMRLSPPRADQWPGVEVHLFRDNRLWRRYRARYAPGQFSASPAGPVMRIGPNCLEPLAEAASSDVPPLSLSLTLPASAGSSNRTPTGPGALDVRLVFRPRSGALLQVEGFPGRHLAGDDHHWIVAAPLCDVTGSVHCDDQTIAFAGRGYHDHLYGTAPPGPGLRGWVRGRVLLENRALAFQAAFSRGLSDDVRLIEADSASARTHHIHQIDFGLWRYTGMRLAYPIALHLGDRLHLARPRIIDRSPFDLHLLYEARLPDRPSPQPHGTALCRIVYPHRLRWPILGRWIEHGITREGRA